MASCPCQDKLLFFDGDVFGFVNASPRLFCQIMLIWTFSWSMTQLAGRDLMPCQCQSRVGWPSWPTSWFPGWGAQAEPTKVPSRQQKGQEGASISFMCRIYDNSDHTTYLYILQLLKFLHFFELWCSNSMSHSASSGAVLARGTDLDVFHSLPIF